MKSNRLSTTNRNMTYNEVLNTLSERRKSVYDVINNNKKGVTSKQIAIALHRPINQVVGRVTELCNMGLIGMVATRRDEITNRPCTVYAPIVNETTFEMSQQQDSVTKKKYRRIKKIIDTYNKLVDLGTMMEHEIIIEMAKVVK